MQEEQGSAGWEYQQAEEAPASFQPLEWSASEYIAHQKNSSWFILLGVGTAVLGLIIFALTRSWLSTITVGLVCLSIGVVGARQPQQIPYRLDEKGVYVGQKFYPYAQFKSFSVVDEVGISCIWLRSLKKFQPTVAMYFAPDEEEAIASFLGEFLPHEERSPDMFDRASSRFRF